MTLASRVGVGWEVDASCTGGATDPALVGEPLDPPLSDGLRTPAIGIVIPAAEACIPPLAEAGGGLEAGWLEVPGA
jgi:hypothetical protein